MTKAKLILIGAILLAGSAAGVVGFVVTRPPPKVVKDPSWLEQKLNLSPQQQKAMKEIWTRTMDDVLKKNSDRRKTLHDEKDAAINEMLSPDQRVEWEEIQQRYLSGLRELERAKEEAFKQATEETMGILSSEQGKLYQQILNDRRPHGDREHHPSRPMMGSDGTSEFHSPRHGGPATRPADAS